VQKICDCHAFVHELVPFWAKPEKAAALKEESLYRENEKRLPEEAPL
jgi:hypothetical protein